MMVRACPPCCRCLWGDDDSCEQRVEMAVEMLWQLPQLQHVPVKLSCSWWNRQQAFDEHDSAVPRVVERYDDDGFGVGECVPVPVVHVGAVHPQFRDGSSDPLLWSQNYLQFVTDLCAQRLVADLRRLGVVVLAQHLNCAGDAALGHLGRCRRW